MWCIYGASHLWAKYLSANNSGTCLFNCDNTSGKRKHFRLYLSCKILCYIKLFKLLSNIQTPPFEHGMSMVFHLAVNVTDFYSSKVTLLSSSVLRILPMLVVNKQNTHSFQHKSNEEEAKLPVQNNRSDTFKTCPKILGSWWGPANDIFCLSVNAVWVVSTHGWWGYCYN